MPQIQCPICGIQMESTIRHMDPGVCANADCGAWFMAFHTDPGSMQKAYRKIAAYMFPDDSGMPDESRVNMERLETLYSIHGGVLIVWVKLHDPTKEEIKDVRDNAKFNRAMDGPGDRLVRVTETLREMLNTPAVPRIAVMDQFGIVRAELDRQEATEKEGDRK